MRWRKQAGDESGIEDRRGQGGGGLGGLSGGRIAGGVGGLGIVGVIVALLVSVLGGGGGGFGIPDLNALPAAPAADQNVLQQNGVDADEKLKDFVAFVQRDVQDFWEQQFQAGGQQYQRTVVVLYTNGVTTGGCGQASSAAGPFYCPGDRKVYLDLSFFRELRDRFEAPGDFAQAYVIAHEFGHHVQNLLGVMDQVNRRQNGNPGEANELSVRLELQADCLAGVWAHSVYEKDGFDDGDLQEGLDAAASVGDDRIQQQATGHVDRDSFTHGSSAQRVKWFQAGFENGEMSACNTFSGDI
ncbi:MAG: neutral zinc metallopeptidase [Thermoleophilia bacterium]